MNVFQWVIFIYVALCAFLNFASAIFADTTKELWLKLISFIVEVMILYAIWL
jgi:hypothetical protein